MRLREEAEHKPKAMVEIGGRPILWHIMRHYERFGFNRFVICLGYKGERIREYFLNYEYMNNDFTISVKPGERRLEVHPHPALPGDRVRAGDQGAEQASWEVTLVDTGQTAMTGARLKRIERYIDTDEFFCTYGDGLCNVNIQDLQEFHRGHGRYATITGVSPISRFGTLVTSGDRVCEFAEKPELKDSLINGGFFVFSRKVFDYLSVEDDCILEQAPFLALARDGNMMTYRHRGYWQCMDTPRDVQQLNDEWQRGPGWTVLDR
jgi:glucose-1-phosphate cytidylyltransferase